MLKQPNHSEYGIVCLNRGKAKADQMDHAAAIQDFTTALDLFSPGTLYEKALCYAFRGISYAALNKHDSAIDSLTLAINTYPETHTQNKVLFYLNRGDSYSKLNNHALAIRDYTTALGFSLEPIEKIFCFLYRGRSYANQNTHEPAIQDYKDALSVLRAPEFRPEDTYVYKADCYLHLGVSYANQNKHRKALSCYTQALDLYPNNHPNRSFCIYYCGQSNTALNKHSVAIQNYSDAIRLNPEVVEQFNAAHLKDFYMESPAFYEETLKKHLSFNQRVAACYGSEIPPIFEQLNLLDPITFKIMDDPISFSSTGCTYDRSTVAHWFYAPEHAIEGKSPLSVICPLTGKEILWEDFQRAATHRNTLKLLEQCTSELEQIGRRLISAPEEEQVVSSNSPIVSQRDQVSKEILLAKARQDVAQADQKTQLNEPQHSAASEFSLFP